MAKSNGSVDVDAGVDADVGVGIDISGLDISERNESQYEWQILKSELLETIRSHQIQLQDQNDLLKSQADQIQTLNDLSTNKSDQINTQQIKIQNLNDQVREECRKNQYLSEEIQVLKDRLGDIQQSCRSNLARFAMDATTSTNPKVCITVGFSFYICVLMRFCCYKIYRSSVKKKYCLVWQLE